jgi:Nif-specific regulatory protein
VSRRANLPSDDQRALAVLAEIGRALARGGEVRSVLERALELLEEALGIVRGAVFLFHEDSGALQVDAALGISAEGLGARYRPGEGIIGRVLQSGRPVVVPASAREPLLLNRAFQRRRTGSREVSVLCVPITFDRQPAGVLMVDVPFQQGRDFQSEMQFLGVVASMMAQTLRAQRAIEDERNRLLAENKNLRSELEERYDLSNIIGTSGPMKQVYEQIAQVAQTATTVLVRGESEPARSSSPTPSTTTHLAPRSRSSR